MPAMMIMWVVALVLAVAATTHAVQKKLTHGTGPEPDGVFWDAFAGLVVIVPAILVPTLAWPPAGLLLLLLAAATATGTIFGKRRLERVHAAQPHRRPGFADATARHQEVLARWRRYELDPGQAILFPAMSDVGNPRTAALMRAMREAEHCRMTPGTDYPAAVGRLEQALADAEHAAGVPAEILSN